MTQDFDIVIIGSGMVGASLACALEGSPWRIALLDRAPSMALEDARLIALNHASICLFKNIGLWPSLSEFAGPISSVHVSDKGHFGKVRLAASGLGLSALGYVVPAKHINRSLDKALSHCARFQNAQLDSLEKEPDGVKLSCTIHNEKQTIRAKLVIGADGTDSTVRKALDLKTQTLDYDQDALVTITHLQREHQEIAYERFHRGGAIAMLPLKGLAVATIISDTRDKIANLMTLSDEDFLQNLQKNFGYHLGRLVRTEKRQTYPLKRLQCEHLRDDRIILIGNAAHTLHPIASQGLNLALTEIAMLRDSLYQSSADLTQIPWKAYWDFQEKQEKASKGLSHSLVNIFSKTSPPFMMARQVAMLGLDKLPFAKKFFLKRALGRLGKAPTLLIDPSNE